MPGRRSPSISTSTLLTSLFLASSIPYTNAKATLPNPNPNADCPIPSLTPDQFSKLALDYIIIGESACPRRGMRDVLMSGLVFRFRSWWITFSSSVSLHSKIRVSKNLPNTKSLSENPNIKVGLIEAGVFHLNDPTVDIPRTSCPPHALNNHSIGNSEHRSRRR